jgi:cyclic pyranopterin phosphate synthase
MVDIGGKAKSDRTARAVAVVQCQKKTIDAIQASSIAKGNVFEVARLAGIMAAKKTAELIPLCHNISLDSIAIEITVTAETLIEIAAMVGTNDRTGVEMEALTAASVTALTIYDMCKSIDRSMSIHNIHLVEKRGGKSGDFVRKES